MSVCKTVVVTLKLWVTRCLTRCHRPGNEEVPARDKVEIGWGSCRNRGPTKEMRRSVDAWSFPDSGTQVVMIPPCMVSAMGGDSLVVPATLEITNAGGHSLPESGAIFISITRWDKGTGAVRRTKQMA